VPNSAPASTAGGGSTIAAQNATTSGYNGGNLTLNAGNGGSSANGGYIYLNPGTSTSGTTGKVVVNNNDMYIQGVTVGRGPGTGASVNSALGKTALISNTSGTYNSGFGNAALYSNLTGNDNTALGSNSMQMLNDPNGKNTAVGSESFRQITTGGENVAVGYRAGLYQTDGTSNITTANQSVFIGSNSKSLGVTSTNQIVIGSNAIGNGTNTTTIGNSSTTTTYIPASLYIGGATTGTTLTVGKADGTVGGEITLNPTSIDYEGGQIDIKKSITNANYDWFIDQYAGTGSPRFRILPSRSPNTESYGFEIAENGNIGMGVVADASSSYRLNVAGDINSSGSVRASGVALTSDFRLKRNIVPITNGLAILNLLKPVSYDKKISLADSVYSRKELGFIAQEVQKVLPQLVMESKDKDHLLSLDYISIVPLLTKAIQEQDVVIKIAQKENESLKSQLDAQQKRLVAIEELLKKFNLEK